MSTHTDLEPEQRKALVSRLEVLVAAVTSDGEVTDDQRAFLEATYGELGISGKTLDTALARGLREDKGFELSESAKQNPKLFQMAIYLVTHDGEVHPDERALVLDLAKQYDIPETDCEALLRAGVRAALLSTPLPVPVRLILAPVNLFLVLGWLIAHIPTAGYYKPGASPPFIRSRADLRILSVVGAFVAVVFAIVWIALKLGG